MSHRITTETNITNKALAIKALNKAGWAFYESGEDNLNVTSGPMSGSTLNLKTGQVSGDSDYVDRSDNSMGALKSFYAEAKFRKNAIEQGIDIVERVVEKNGDIVLTCRKMHA